MTKRKWIYVVCIGMILCVGVIFFIIIQQRKQSASTAKRNASQNTEWQDFNPFDFNTEDILSITYIKDRSGLGEKNNLCWYIDDEVGIQAIMDCIEQDTSYHGYFDWKENPSGNTVIVLWFVLSDGSSKKLIYTDAWLTYDDITYKIINREDSLKHATSSLLKDYQPTEISGIDNPYGR